MKHLFFTVIIILTYFQSFAQSAPDTIEVKKTLGTVFRQHGQNLTPRQLMDLTQSNPEAHQKMQKARSNHQVGSVIGFAGGLLVGSTLGTAVSGGDANWTLAGIGAALIGVSVPFSSAYTRHAKEAVKIYNGGSKQTGMRTLDLGFTLTGSGMAIKMVF
jgi:hypothetical protein